MENKKIEILYEIVIRGFKLSKKVLNEYSFKEEEIEKLIKENIINPIDNDMYELVDIESLRQYGLNLLKLKQPKKARTCFQRCYELAPNNTNICYQYLLSKIKNQHNESYLFLEKIDKISNQEEKQYNKIYTYLLNYLIEYPEEYIEKISSMIYPDLIIPSNEKINNIISFIMQNKYIYAFSLTNDLISETEVYDVKLNILKELLSRVATQEKQLKREINLAVNKKEYHKIITLLSNKQKRMYLTNMEAYIYIVSQAIINIKNTKIIPEITINYTDNIYEAIQGNNFILAKKINEEFLNFRNIPKEKDTLNILLTNIISLIKYMYIEANQNKTVENNTSTPKELISHTDLYNKQNNIDEIEKEAEELAYFIETIGTDFETSKQKLGLMPEANLLITLIKARDFYIESLYSEGDKLIQEVEESRGITDKVIILLNQIKKDREQYKNMKLSHAKKLIKQK